MTQISRQPHSEKGDPHWMEWAVGIFSALLVLTIIGWVGFEAITEEDQSPTFRTVITRKEAVEGGFRVEFEIENLSTRTAAAVVVRGEIRDGDNAVETGEATIDYVPAQSKSYGAIIFSSDPGEKDVWIRGAGYSEP
ncbi:TIGR02588 family protein [Pararhizobium gei]|uniref:TIGR02588 family protein n=1 Tax=Pararhizobium gei TaxID=1395951 RepID=UPI0023DC462A|nr:TIGR02588 family protein [Rhizobium gei]